jgi:hypothetical protein
MRGLNHPYIIEYRGYFTDFDFGEKIENKSVQFKEYEDTHR